MATLGFLILFGLLGAVSADVEVWTIVRFIAYFASLWCFIMAIMCLFG